MAGMFFLGVFAIAIMVVKSSGQEGVKYEGIGCYNDNMSRPLPVLLMNFRGSIDWDNEWPSFERVIKECAKLAYSKGYAYFGIQFYGECWTGSDAYKRFYEKGVTDRCVHGVGKEWANYVYMIITPDRSECSRNVYRELNEKTRSINVKSTNSNFYCDDKITTQGEEHREWFRFTGQAGNSLAMHAPHSKYCSTLSGGWMKGDLPKEKDTAVNRMVCFPEVPYYGSSDPCEFTAPIKVHNCGHFFVYKLPANPRNCKFRYCGDTIALQDY